MDSQRQKQLFLHSSKLFIATPTLRCSVQLYAQQERIGKLFADRGLISDVGQTWDVDKVDVSLTISSKH